MFLLVVAAILLYVGLATRSWWRRDPYPIPEFPGALPIIGHSLQILGDRKLTGSWWSEKQSLQVKHWYPAESGWAGNRPRHSWEKAREKIRAMVCLYMSPENNKIHLWNFLRKTQVYSLENGGLCELRLGSHSFYSTTDPEDSLTLSNTCLNKVYTYHFANDFLNNGLITANASVWKAHRKLLNPSFSQQVLNTYLDEMNVQSRRVVSQLASRVGKDPFDVRKYLINYTLSTLTGTSLGLNNEDHTAIDTDYAEAIDELLTIYSDRINKPWLHLSFLYKWSALKYRENQLLEKLKNIINPIIYKRKSELQKNKDPSIHSNVLGKNKSIVDQMLHLADERNAFTDDDIREHLDTFVAAAYDTTSTTLTYTLLVIGENPNIQERIFEELQEVLQQKDEDFTKHDLQNLVYLEAVIKETMRMYPVVPVIGRTIDVDVKLKNYTLRAGNSCQIGLYGLLRHPMWGADVEQFRPERWLDPASLPKHPSLNAGFGVGKRNCIGKVFGMMTMKIVLAHILRRYHVTGNISNVVCEFDMSLKPVEGHHIQLTSRIQNSNYTL